MGKHYCERCGGPSTGIYKHCSHCVSADLVQMMAERREDQEEKDLTQQVIAASEQLFRELLINPQMLPICTQAALIELHKKLLALNQYKYGVSNDLASESAADRG